MSDRRDHSAPLRAALERLWTLSPDDDLITQLELKTVLARARTGHRGRDHPVPSPPRGGAGRRRALAGGGDRGARVVGRNGARRQRRSTCWRCSMPGGSTCFNGRPVNMFREELPTRCSACWRTAVPQWSDGCTRGWKHSTVHLRSTWRRRYSPTFRRRAGAGRSDERRQVIAWTRTETVINGLTLIGATHIDGATMSRVLDVLILGEDRADA